MPAKTLLLLLIAATAACSKPADPPSSTAEQAREAAAPGPPDGSNLVADANEPPEVIERYREARQLITEGRRDAARALLGKATAEFPESRHLHQLYADLLWDLSAGTDRELLAAASREAVRATEIGLRLGNVDPALTARLAETLGRTGDRETFESIFSRLLAASPSPTTRQDYARGLVLLGDPRAEEALRKAADADPNGDAVAQYGEWLLDHGRERDALERLPVQTPLHYLHFLRGVALERLGRVEEARAEYDQFRDFSRTFPAPERFRVQDSQAQQGIRFGAGQESK